MLIDKIASETTLAKAYQWLCQEHGNCSSHDDALSFSFRWQEVKFNIQQQFCISNYQVSSFHHLCEYVQRIFINLSFSSLLSAITLLPLAQAMTQNKIYYMRFIDARCILTRTRKQLHQVITVTHEVLKCLKQTMHLCKTFIDRICKGFSFLGYYFSPKELRIVKQMLTLAADKLTRLYEHIGVMKDVGIEKDMGRNKINEKI